LLGDLDVEALALADLEAPQALDRELVARRVRGRRLDDALDGFAVERLGLVAVLAELGGLGPAAPRAALPLRLLRCGLRRRRGHERSPTSAVPDSRSVAASRPAPSSSGPIGIGPCGSAVRTLASRSSGDSRCSAPLRSARLPGISSFCCASAISTPGA